MRASRRSESLTRFQAPPTANTTAATPSPERNGISAACGPPKASAPAPSAPTKSGAQSRRQERAANTITAPASAPAP